MSLKMMRCSIVIQYMPINLRDWMDGSSIQTWNEAQRDCDLYCCKNRGNFWFVSIHNRIKLLIGHIDKNCFPMPGKSYLFWAFQQDFSVYAHFSSFEVFRCGCFGHGKPIYSYMPMPPEWKTNKCPEGFRISLEQGTWGCLRLHIRRNHFMTITSDKAGSFRLSVWNKSSCQHMWIGCKNTFPKKEKIFKIFPE